MPLNNFNIEGIPNGLTGNAGYDYIFIPGIKKYERRTTCCSRKIGEGKRHQNDFSEIKVLHYLMVS